MRSCRGGARLDARFRERACVYSDVGTKSEREAGDYGREGPLNLVKKLSRGGMAGASAPAGNQPADAKDRRVCNAGGRAGIRLLNGALPVMPLRIANIVMAAAL
jgi:hypothetical protein